MLCESLFKRGHVRSSKKAGRFEAPAGGASTRAARGASHDFTGGGNKKDLRCEQLADNVARQKESGAPCLSSHLLDQIAFLGHGAVRRVPRGTGQQQPRRVDECHDRGAAPSTSSTPRGYNAPHLRVGSVEDFNRLVQRKKVAFGGTPVRWQLEDLHASSARRCSATRGPPRLFALPLCALLCPPTRRLVYPPRLSLPS